MLSVLSHPQQLSQPLGDQQSKAKTSLKRLPNLTDALEPFTNLILTSGRSSIRLHCTIPTWSLPTDTCIDLHDLHELRTRLILFIHNLLQCLRSSGIIATYSLSPSSSSHCLICVLPPNGNAHPPDMEALTTECSGRRDNVVLANGENGPFIVVI